MKLLVATRSAHKLAEIREILSATEGLEVVGLDDLGVAYDLREEELEPYESFEENAYSKARYFRALTGLATAADDSGLEVEGLDGRPGVRSKRFAPFGGDVTAAERDHANNAHLLLLLARADDRSRTARYVCVVALDEGDGGVTTLRGEAAGVIAHAPRGNGGFGYDPLFIDPVLGRTFGEITADEKNARSHRGAAFRALGAHLSPRPYPPRATAWGST